MNGRRGGARNRDINTVCIRFNVGNCSTKRPFAVSETQFDTIV